MGWAICGIRTELTDALQRQNFDRLKELAARNGLSKKELMHLAREYNTRRQKFQPEEFAVVLAYTSRRKVQVVFGDVVKERLWRATGAFLERGLCKRLRHFAVRQDLSDVEDCDLEVILPHCVEEQYDEVFTLCLDKGLWKAVGKLLERKKTGWRKSGSRASVEQYKRAFEEATKRANRSRSANNVADGSRSSLSLADRSRSSIVSNETIDDHDLSEILSSCAAQQSLQDDCLKQAGIRGLWKTVLHILELKAEAQARKNTGCRRILAKIKRSVPQGLDTVDTWAIKQAAEHADEDTMTQFLSFCQEDMLETVLKRLVERDFWFAATELLLIYDEDSASCESLSSSQQTVNSLTTTSTLASNRFRTDADRIDYVLRESLRQKLWDVVKELHAKGRFTSEQAMLVNQRVTQTTGILDFPLERHGPKRPMQAMLELLVTSDAGK